MSDSRYMSEIHAQWDGCELALNATEAGLHELARDLRSARVGAYVLGERNASPGCTSILRLQIELGEGNVRIEVDDQVAILSGGGASLSLLADNLDFLRSQWANGGKQHLHLDPASNAFLVSEDSEAFIVGPME
jgi:hypothetical protein